MEKRKAYRRFKAAARELKESLKDLSRCNKKDAKWLAPRLQKFFEQELSDQEMSNTLSNLDKLANPPQTLREFSQPNPATDELPF